ncbi:hypothetical protein VTK56DRAFT_4158 [Thermocarpiscus australiensis]
MYFMYSTLRIVPRRLFFQPHSFENLTCSRGIAEPVIFIWSVSSVRSHPDMQKFCSLKQIREIQVRREMVPIHVALSPPTAIPSSWKISADERRILKPAKTSLFCERRIDSATPRSTVLLIKQDCVKDRGNPSSEKQSSVSKALLILWIVWGPTRRDMACC